MVKKADQLNKELIAFVNILVDSFKVYAVVLYGSYAAGKADDNSDIDIAVFMEEYNDNIFETMKKLFKLRRMVDTDIEPLPFRKLDFFEHDKADFVNEILTKGKILYENGRLLI